MQQQTPGPNVAHSNRGFPSQLFAMLEQVEEDGMSHIVSWRPHGRAFKVHRKAQFVENVLPLWFRHSNYNSFQRQLNIYGFRRFPEGRDKDAYYHENFVRGQYERSLRIGRNAVKGTRVRRPDHHASFPDLYERIRGDEIDTSDRATERTTPTTHRNADRHPPTSPQLPVAPSLAQSNDTQSQRIELDSNLSLTQAHIQQYLALAMSNRNYDGSNQTMDLLPSSVLSQLLTSGRTEPPSSLERYSLESLLLLQTVHPPNPSVVERLLQQQALTDSLQQQRRHAYGVPPFLGDNARNLFSHNNAAVNTELLDLILRQSLNPPGTGL